MEALFAHGQEQGMALCAQGTSVPEAVRPPPAFAVHLFRRENSGLFWRGALALAALMLLLVLPALPLGTLPPFYDHLTSAGLSQVWLLLVQGLGFRVGAMAPAINLMHTSGQESCAAIVYCRVRGIDALKLLQMHGCPAAAFSSNWQTQS